MNFKNILKSLLTEEQADKYYKLMEYDNEREWEAYRHTQSKTRTLRNFVILLSGPTDPETVQKFVRFITSELRVVSVPHPPTKGDTIVEISILKSSDKATKGKDYGYEIFIGNDIGDDSVYELLVDYINGSIDGGDFSDLGIELIDNGPAIDFGSYDTGAKLYSAGYKWE